jgi:hypothetical protein
MTPHNLVEAHHFTTPVGGKSTKKEPTSARYKARLGSWISVANLRTPEEFHTEFARGRKGRQISRLIWRLCCLDQRDVGDAEQSM